MRKGVTVLELLIVAFLTLITLAAVYSAYSVLFKSYKKEETTSVTAMESAIGLEILRQDVEHAGYGIGKGETKLPVEVFRTPDGFLHLVIRSTYKTSDDDTQGWAILTCPSAGDVPHCLSYYNFPYCPKERTKTEAIVMKPDGDLFLPKGKDYFTVDDKGDTCPSAESVLLAFPISGSGVWKKWDGSTEPSCANQFCNVIEYYLEDDSDALSEYCQGTYILKRKVDLREEPFVECVGDFKVLYNWNGSLCDPEKSSSPCYSPKLNSKTLRENLKMVYIYLLIREGKKDPKFKFKYSGGVPVDGIKLHLPSSDPDAVHYRWRVVKLAVTPMNLKR
ncbi:MAG: hypothetical protein DSY35_00580 [Desulfurobacterium sp.]|nr:MAG: hypothetical protein DSY35_00580 [Desulfurobacterium sp.]